MDSLTPIVVALIVILVGLILAAVIVRVLRSIYLRKVTLSDTSIRNLQAEITENARRASIQPGMEVDLAGFWRKSGIKEPDRRAVVQPLINSNVFGWYERKSSDAFEQFFAETGRLMWNPTRTKVVVSQWVRDGREPAQVVVEQALGPLYFGPVDNSTTFGDRAGRDITGGDRVGGDKSAGDLTKIFAAGSVAGSANQGRTNFDASSITTRDELGSALSALASQAAQRRESDDVVGALRWAAAMAAEDSAPAARDQAKHQRTLDRASGWVRGGLNAILEGVSGALAGEWLVDLLRG